MRFIAVVLFIAATGVSFAAGDDSPATDSLALRPSGWRVNDVDLYASLALVVNDMERQLDDHPVVILEYWDNVSIVVQSPPSAPKSLGEKRMLDNRGGGHMDINHSRPRFAISTTGKSYRQLLDEITAKEGNLIWYYRKDENVIHIVEKHLASDPRWPLNWEIPQSMLTTDLSSGQCMDILSEKYNLITGHMLARKLNWKANGPVEKFLPVENTEIVWHGKNAANIKVRDFVTKIILAGQQPGSWFFIRVSPNHIHPNTGYAGLSDRETLNWVLNIPIARDLSSVNKQIDAEKSLEAREDAAH